MKDNSSNAQPLPVDFDVVSGVSTSEVSTSPEAHSLPATTSVNHEQGFGLLWENVSDLVTEVDETGCYTYASPNHLQVLGTDPSELLGHPAMNWVHPDDVERIVEQLQAVGKGQSEGRVELRSRRADGHWHWFECVVRAHQVPGQGLRFLSVSRDISERKRLEYERALFLRLGELIHAQPHLSDVARVLAQTLRPLLPFDLFFISLVQNDALRVVASELDAQNSGHFILGLNRQSDAQTWARLVDEQQAVLCNDYWPERFIAEPFVGTHREDNLHTRSYINTPLVVNGETMGVLHFDSLAPDVFTSQHVRLTVAIAQHIAGAVRQMEALDSARQAESQARQAEERFRQLVQQIEAIVWEGDPRANVFTWVSPQVETWLGLSPQSWIGPIEGDFSKYLHPDDREQVLREWVFDAGKKEHCLEFRLVGLQGQVLWVRNLVSVETDLGVPVRMHGIMFDITERKRQEQEQALLWRLMQAINAQSDLPSLVRELRRHLQPLVPCDVLFISRVRGEWLRTEAVDPPDHLKRDWQLKINDRLTPYNDPKLWDAIEGRRVHAHNDLSVFTPPDDVRLHIPNETRAFINVPLVVNDQLLGLLHIDSFLPNVYTPDHFRVAQLVGAEVAIAMQQALLIEHAQNSEAEVRESNAILQATQEAAADGMFLVDEAGIVVSCNRRFGELWQIEPDVVDELRQKQQLLLYILSMMSEPDEFLKKITYLVDFPNASTRDEISLNDGRTFERFSSPAIAPDGRIYGRVWSFSDLTERKQYEHRLTHQAFHDPLTELPNRALFMENLTRALARAQRAEETVAVLFLDLDRFKVVNDSLGHETGDQLLIEASKRLKGCLRPGDTAARFGGDEFTVLLENVENMAAATGVAERISEALGTPFDLNGHEVYTTASVGIVLSGGHDRGEELLRDADVAMYRAKNKGRARFEVFDSEMSAQAFERLKVEIDLRQALKRNQLRLHYQPLVDLESGRIVGAEALVRWQHPERGLIMPGEFIELAEECGMILPLGSWVLREACAQAKAWTRKYFGPENEPGDQAQTPFLMSVNLSVKQFSQLGLVDEVEHALRDAGLPAAQLNLEITESVMMQAGGVSHGLLQSLRALGVQLALDDFGTGFSSLSYLKEFPLDALKVDRSFVARFANHAQDRAIVQAVHDLAKALGMKVVGEGVETPEQLGQLRHMGCDVGQGYFFSKPLPPELFAQLLETAPRW